jgi:hypothetical protein
LDQFWEKNNCPKDLIAERKKEAVGRSVIEREVKEIAKSLAVEMIGIAEKERVETEEIGCRSQIGEPHGQRQQKDGPRSWEFIKPKHQWYIY